MSVCPNKSFNKDTFTIKAAFEDSLNKVSIRKVLPFKVICIVIIFLNFEVLS